MSATLLQREGEVNPAREIVGQILEMLSLDGEDTARIERSIKAAKRPQDLVSPLKMMGDRTGGDESAFLSLIGVQVLVKSRRWHALPAAVRETRRKLRLVRLKRDSRGIEGHLTLAQAKRDVALKRTTSAKRRFRTLADSETAYFAHVGATHLGLYSLKNNRIGDALHWLGRSASMEPDRLLMLRGYSGELVDLLRKRRIVDERAKIFSMLPINRGTFDCSLKTFRTRMRPIVRKMKTANKREKVPVWKKKVPSKKNVPHQFQRLRQK